jgi:hypothetical protein
LYQVIAIHTIDGAVAKLGITPDEAAALFGEASHERTGLGLLCRNPTGGTQPGTKVGERCTKVEACIDCPASAFFASTANTSDLMLFGEYLRSKEPEMIAQRLERWETYWLKWLAFADVMVARIHEEEPRLFIEASALTDARRSAGVYFPDLY